jgi:tetratricopeptide (TPR) repeat protein
VTQTFSQVSSPPTACYQLLPDIADFTGRMKETARLQALLKAAGAGNVHALIISNIAGKPGVGKSALAIHVAHLLAKRFPDAQLYVNLRGQEGRPLSPAEILPGFLAALGVEGGKVPPNVDDQQALYRSLLADKQAIVLLDNARSSAQVRSLLPGSASCAVLVTSRKVLAGLEGAETLALEVMRPREAQRLLANVVGSKRVGAEPGFAQQIASLCGYLPLALRIAAAMLKARPRWSLARLAKRLADEQTRLAVLHVEDLQVRVSFALSYEDLSENERRAFRLLGLLPGQDFSPGVLAALMGCELQEAEELVEHLAESQLLEALFEDRYTFHDLIRLFARERLSEEDPEVRGRALERALGWYLRTAQAAADTLIEADLRKTSARSPRVEEAVVSDLALLEAERSNLMAAIERASELELWGTAQDLAQTMAHFLSLRGYWNDWEHTQALALAAARQSGDRAKESRALRGLGNAYRSQDRLDDAISCYEQALGIYRGLGDRHEEGHMLNILGMAHRHRFDDAISCYEQALGIYRGLDDRHGEGQTLNNLGVVYHVKDRFLEAISCYEQALEIYLGKQALAVPVLKEQEAAALDSHNLWLPWSNSSRSTDLNSYSDSPQGRKMDIRHGGGHALNNLGVVYQYQGHCDEAISCYQQALEIYRELGDRHGEGLTLNNLGVIYLAESHFDEAISCYQQGTWLAPDALPL